MSKDNFQWDDKAVQDFAEQYRFSSSRTSMDQFKASHQPKEPSKPIWEIFSDCRNQKSKPEKERIEVSQFGRHDVLHLSSANAYQFCTSENMPSTKWKEIIAAIEQVLNDEPDAYTKYLKTLLPTVPIYNQQQVDELCKEAFNAARKAWTSSIKQPFDGEYVHPTFQDYITAKQKTV